MTDDKLTEQDVPVEKGDGKKDVELIFKPNKKSAAVKSETFNLIANQGELCLNNFFTLLAAGPRWIKAYDYLDSTHITSVPSSSCKENHVH